MKELAFGLYEIAWLCYNKAIVVREWKVWRKSRRMSRQTHFMPYSQLIITFSYANNLHGTYLNLMLVKW